MRFSGYYEDVKEGEREGVVLDNNFRQVNERIGYYECNFENFDFASEYITGVTQYVLSERKYINMLSFRNRLRTEILKINNKKRRKKDK